MSQTKQPNNYRLAVAMTIAVFCMGQIPGSIDAAISKITEFFNLTSTTGLYVTTAASLVSVAFSIVIGFVAGKKIGFKPLIMFCAVVELISSIAPFFTKSFAVLIALRSLFGLGFGGMQSLENTVATKLITPEKRASVLGLGTFFGFGTNCVLQLIGGILADKGWNYVFLNHLLLIIPFAIVVIGCIRLDFGGKDRVKTADNAEKVSGKLTAGVFQSWVLMFFIGIMIAPLLIGCSFLSEPINPSATVAGIVAVCFSVGCMVGGLMYSRLFKALGKLALPIFLVVIAIGFTGCAATRSIVILCIFIFLAGAGFSSAQAMCMTVLGLACPQKIAFASAIMMALFNLGMFLSSPFEEIVGKLTGDSLYMPLYISTAIMIAFAVIYGIFSPLRGKESR